MGDAAAEKLKREQASKQILIGIALIILSVISMIVTTILGNIFDNKDMGELGRTLGFIGVIISFFITATGIAARINHVSLKSIPLKFETDKAFFTKAKTLSERLLDKKVNIRVLTNDAEHKFYGIIKKIEGDLIFLEMLGSGDSSDNTSSPDSASSWQIINTASSHFVRAEIVEVK